jgi:hypothetical protein
VLREGIFPKKEAVRLGKDKPFIAFFLKNVKVGGGLNGFVVGKRGKSAPLFFKLFRKM